MLSQGDVDEQVVLNRRIPVLILDNRKGREHGCGRLGPLGGRRDPRELPRPFRSLMRSTTSSMPAHGRTGLPEGPLQAEEISHPSLHQQVVQRAVGSGVIGGLF